MPMDSHLQQNYPDQMLGNLENGSLPPTQKQWSHTHPSRRLKSHKVYKKPLSKCSAWVSFCWWSADVADLDPCSENTEGYLTNICTSFRNIKWRFATALLKATGSSRRNWRQDLSLFHYIFFPLIKWNWRSAECFTANLFPQRKSKANEPGKGKLGVCNPGSLLFMRNPLFQPARLKSCH